MTYTATAEGWSSIRFGKPGTAATGLREPRRSEEEPKHLSSTFPRSAAGDDIVAPIRIRPEWVGRVERRIRSSIARDDGASQDGQWISWTIALQSMSFFEKTFDLLPGEPYIYSSLEGDLVAEYRTKRGSMTLILGPTSVMGFAQWPGREPVKVSIDVRTTTEKKTREAICRLTGATNPDNESVDAEE